MVGSFTTFRSISSEEMEMINVIMAPLTGVTYTPLAVATQVINGTKFAFLCEAQAIVPDSVPSNVMVYIIKPQPIVDGLPWLDGIAAIKVL